MIRDDDLTAQALDGRSGPECARVVIETTAGTTFELFNSVAIGAPSKPMSDDDLDTKFRTLAGYGSVKNAETLLARLRSIDSLPNTRNLMP